jgi:YtxH-like protein
MSNPFDISSTRLLRMLGLQARRSVVSTVLPTVGLFGVGLLTGAGLGLLFAPRKGSDMRRELGSKITDASHRVGETATKVARKLKRTARDVGDEVTSAIDEARDSAAYGGNGVSPL